EITNLSTEVTLYMQKIPRLQVHWQDNLPKGTTYNVLVSAVNSTRCPDAPCSEYTIKGKPAKFIYLPQSPNPNVESVDCNYMFGCQYNVTVETSNLLARRSMRIFIPHCVAGKCSCQMTPSPPKILARAKMQANDTISIAFTILAGEQLRQEPETPPHEALQAYKMQLKINEEGNPSLPWGGVLKNLFNRMYNLSELHFKPTSKGYDGNMTLTLGKQLKEKASLNLQALIIDANGCEGPRSVTKVPGEHTHVNKPLIVMATLLIAVILTGLLLLMMRRRRARNNAQLQKEQIYMQSFGASPVEMEDNINYVDKYVEQSQALGLADIFEVPHSAIHIGQMLGEGAFGRVHEATAINLRRMRGTTIVAVKQLKANPSADEVAEFLSEIEMLKGVGTHNNVVCFLGCCTIRPPYLMIMEYVGRGNLLNYLRAVRQELGQPKTRNANSTSCRPNSAASGSGAFHTSSTAKAQTVNYIELKASSHSRELDKSLCSTNSTGYASNGDATGGDVLNRLAKPSFSETTYTIVEDEEPFEYILDNKELHNFALQIANGMRFLEEQEITHRDLAARNVLIDNNKTLKISDFGLSRHGIYTNTKTRKVSAKNGRKINEYNENVQCTMQLPLRWLSIEAIRDNVYSSKSDIWAYGVVLWEIGTLGASPYPTISNSELIPFLLSGNRLERPEICTPQVYTIMLQCWLEEPEERPTFDALYKVLSPKTTYVDINSLSDDYVFPPIKE
ncbi:hypothetical protein KR044_002836, partial [Drosophila immigrans]